MAATRKRHERSASSLNARRYAICSATLHNMEPLCRTLFAAVIYIAAFYSVAPYKPTLSNDISRHEALQVQRGRRSQFDASLYEPVPYKTHRLTNAAPPPRVCFTEQRIPTEHLATRRTLTGSVTKHGTPNSCPGRRRANRRRCHA